MISEAMLFITAPRFPQVGSIFPSHHIIMLVLSSKCRGSIILSSTCRCSSESDHPTVSPGYYRVSCLSLIVWFTGFTCNSCIWPVIKIRSHLHPLLTFFCHDSPQLHNSGTRAWFHATPVLMCSGKGPCLLANHQLLPWSVMPTSTAHILVAASKVFKALQ